MWYNTKFDDFCSVVEMLCGLLLRYTLFDRK